jgi:hypothetical protein
MSTLYVYNIGRQIHIQIDNIHIQYLGSKALNKFLCINSYSDGCISINTEFNIDNQLEVEEDYIDLRDVLGDYNYNTEKIINSISKIKIGEPQMEQIEQIEKMSKKDLIEKSLMVSDNMALMNNKSTNNQVQIMVVNMKNTNARAIVSISDFSVISSNMTKDMLKRAVEAVKRNHEQLIEEIREKKVYA